VVGPEEQQKALDEAIRNAGVVCEGLSAVLSRGHPVRAVACAELGKLLAADEPAPASPPAPAPAVVKPDGSSAAVTAATATATAAKATSVFPPSDVQRILLAKTVLAQAHEELVIGFGKEKDAEGGDVGREVRELLVRLEGELGVLKNGIRNVRQSERAAG
jgi:3-oxoacyl-ACP reductase-like protein